MDARRRGATGGFWAEKGEKSNRGSNLLGGNKKGLLGQCKTDPADREGGLEDPRTN